MTRDPIAAMQSLIDELRSEHLPPSRVEYERACAAYFDYQTAPNWKAKQSIALADHAEKLRDELNKQ